MSLDTCYLGQLPSQHGTGPYSMMPHHACNYPCKVPITLYISIELRCAYQKNVLEIICNVTTISYGAALETNVGPLVWDRQLLVRTSKFLHISLQINVWISQNSDQDRQLFQLSAEQWYGVMSWACAGSHIDVIIVLVPIRRNSISVLYPPYLFSSSSCRCFSASSWRISSR